MGLSKTRELRLVRERRKAKGRKEKREEEKEIKYLPVHGGEWGGVIWLDSSLGGRILWLSQVAISLFLGFYSLKLGLKVNGMCKWFYKWRAKFYS